MVSGTGIKMTPGKLVSSENVAKAFTVRSCIQLSLEAHDLTYVLSNVEVHHALNNIFSCHRGSYRKQRSRKVFFYIMCILSVII